MRPKTTSLGTLFVCSTCLLSAIAQAQEIFVGGTLTNATGMPLTNAVLRAESGIVALSDGQGRYAFSVPLGWSGSLTPEKAGWVFTPAWRSYTNLSGDAGGQDFLGRPDLPTLSAHLSNGVPLLSWSARTGETYRVEVSRDLKQWDVLGEPVRVETNPAMRAVELEGYSRWFARVAQPAWEYRAVTGQVMLPLGSGLNLGSLQVLGGQNTSAVTPEGGFSVFQPGSGPALVALMASNQPVLLGYVGAPGGGVSAQSTANWLLFQAVGGGQLPPSTWAQALALIQSSPEVQGLAGVIGQCVATNPLALAQGEVTISNALWGAAGTLVQTNGSPALPGRSRKDDPEDLQAGSLVIEGPYPAQQTGLRCEHNPEGAGLVLVNDYRRHLKYFVYRVGYEDPQGVTHELPAAEWKRVNVINNYLPGVNGVEGVLSSLTGVLLDQVAYGPSVSSEIRLTVQPEKAKKVFYRVVVTGPGMKAEVPEVLRTHPLRAGEWAPACQRMQMLEFVKEYFVPWFFAAVPADAVGQRWGDHAELGFELVGEASGVGLDLGTTIAANDYAAAGQSLFYALVNDADLREDVLNVARKYGWVTVGEAGVEALAQLVPSLLSGLGIVDRLIRQMDLALVSDHIARSFPLVYWDVTVLPPRVELEASDRAANGAEAVNLTATVTPMPDLTNSFVKFHWTTSGQGKLKHQLGAIVREGTDFEVVVTNGSCTVSYQNRDDAQHGAIETVRVAVKRVDVGVEGVREVLVGEGTNQLFVINVAAALKPAETNLLVGEQAVLTLKLEPVEPKGLSNVVYTWTLNGSSGSLSGGDDLRRTYTAAAHGGDVVKVAVKGDYGGKTYALTETKADLKVVPVRVTLKPSGSSMGQDRVLTLTAQVEPEPAEGQLVYRWQNTGPAGELIGGNDQQTSWPTNQFRSSATVEGTNRVTVTAYLVTDTETNELGQARTVLVVARWPAWQPPVEVQDIESYVIGDWNRDGFPDLAVLTQEDRDPEDEGEPWSGVRILLNQSGHGFTNTISFAATAAPAKSSSLDLVLADWNGDGIEDLLWGYDYRSIAQIAQGHHTVVLRVLPGDGRGGFSLGALRYLDPPETDPIEYHTRLKALSTGDVDGDGDLDLLANVNYLIYEEVGDEDEGHVNVGTIEAGVALWRHATNGTLPEPEYFGWHFHGTNCNVHGAPPGRPITADLNGDGSADIIFQGGGDFYEVPNPPNGTYLLLNDRTGRFPAEPQRIAGNTPPVAVADFNGDDCADLWFGDGTVGWPASTGGSFVVQMNDCTGTFTNTLSVTVPAFPELPPSQGLSFTGCMVDSVTDINGDSHPDFRCYAYVRPRPPPYWSRVWLFFMVNDGDGAFTPTPLSEVTGTQTGSVDMDGDGDLDLLKVGNTIGVLLNNGDNTF